VLLVVLIFLMLSTTYSKFTELQLKLPVADADAQRDYPKEVIVAVSSDGRFSIKGQHRGLAAASRAVAQALSEGAKAGKDSVVIITGRRHGPASVRHYRDGGGAPFGLNQITFATQSSAQAGNR
jgi:biopolymer transport protein ExbD